MSLEDAIRDGLSCRINFSNFGSLKSTETAVRWKRVGEPGENFSNFGSLKSTETFSHRIVAALHVQISAISARWRALKLAFRLVVHKPSLNFSNFGSLKSTETHWPWRRKYSTLNFSNFGSLKSTETAIASVAVRLVVQFQQFRLVEEHWNRVELHHLDDIPNFISAISARWRALKLGIVDPPRVELHHHFSNFGSLKSTETWVSMTRSAYL